MDFFSYRAKTRKHGNTQTLTSTLIRLDVIPLHDLLHRAYEHQRSPSNLIAIGIHSTVIGLHTYFIKWF